MPKVLVANRGEIAIRVIRAAKELGWSTVAIYIEGDSSHASYADQRVKLDESGAFLDINAIARVAHETKCTHVHPGYGFLSEHPGLPEALSSLSPPITFVGPSSEVLRVAGDKMLSRELARSLGVEISPGKRVSSAPEVAAFGSQVGYPVMIKALDGGGGRGIRVANGEGEVEEAFRRCQGESPSRQVFAEKALTGPGWKHIEVQIVGDGTGSVNHFWERECSVQRWFQKVVELAPSRLPREMIHPLLDASLKISRHLKYHGLGTFEFLVDAKAGKWVFLEINPRVQVEHTVTEEVNDVDLVRAQLQLFDGKTLGDLSLDRDIPPPSASAVQLRITAEDPAKGFQLSPGAIRASDVLWPAGRRVRIDTWLSHGPNAPPSDWTIGTDFDSLLAKIIVRGPSFEEMTQKAQCALSEFSIAGPVQTNATVLAGIINHPDWAAGDIDTLWLERNAKAIIKLGAKAYHPPRHALQEPSATTGPSAATALLQPGSLFHLSLAPVSEGGSRRTTKHTITLSSIKQNSFPETLSGTLQTSLTPTPFTFSLSQSSSAAVSAGSFELADPNDHRHIATPLTGKIVELHPALIAASKGADAGNLHIKKGETVMVLSVMKMENTVVAPVDGMVTRVGKGIQVGVVIGEGMLVCALEDGRGSTSRL